MTKIRQMLADWLYPEGKLERLANAAFAAQIVESQPGPVRFGP